MIRHVIGALADSSAQGLLEGLRTPVHVLHRAHEFIPVAEARNLAEHIAGAQLEILPGIDHQPWLLQAHARRAGAHVRCSTTFRSWRNGVVTLGDSMVRTRLLVGADGRRSVVARAFAAQYADVRPGRSCAWYAYWDRSQLTELRAELRHGVFAGAFPTHRAQVLAFVQLPVTAWRPGQGEQDRHITGGAIMTTRPARQPAP